MTRRLNVLVAERVMKWHREFDEEGNELQWRDEWGEPYVPWFDELRLIMNYDEPMRHIPFSTSIGAAWQVVEKVSEILEAKYKHVFVDIYREAGQWWAEIEATNDLPLEIDIVTTGYNKEMNLCLTALRAVGVSEDEIQAAMEVER